MTWSTTPPTYNEWKNAKNRGYWWIKFLLCKASSDFDEHGNSIFWPNIWEYDIVRICSIRLEKDGTKYPLLGPAPLVAHGHFFKDLRLNDKEKTKNLFWCPVKFPGENND